MASNLIRQKKRKVMPRRSLFRKDPSLSLLRTAGDLDVLYRCISITSGLNVSSTSFVNFFITSPIPTLLTTGLPAVTNPWVKLESQFTLFLTNLNNFAIEVDFFIARPKIDYLVTTGTAGPTAIMEEMWTATGGTAGEWSLATNNFFDPRNIPFLGNVMSLRYLGSQRLVPQERVQVLNKFYQQFMTRGRAHLLDSTGITDQWVRGDFSFLVRFRVPIVTGSTSSGRARSGTIITQAQWNEKWFIPNKSQTYSNVFDQPDAVGDQAVFGRNGVDYGALVSGNTTI